MAGERQEPSVVITRRQFIKAARVGVGLMAVDGADAAYNVYTKMIKPPSEGQEWKRRTPAGRLFLDGVIMGTGNVLLLRVRLGQI